MYNFIAAGFSTRYMCGCKPTARTLYVHVAIDYNYGIKSCMLLLHIKPSLFLTLQTSNSSTFLLHEVAKHPEVQEKLLHEIKAVVGDKTTATYEDLQKMTLVRNCIKETLR